MDARQIHLNLAFQEFLGEIMAHTTSTPSGTLIFGSLMKNLLGLTRIQTPPPGWPFLTFFSAF